MQKIPVRDLEARQGGIPCSLAAEPEACSSARGLLPSASASAPFDTGTGEDTTSEPGFTFTATDGIVQPTQESLATPTTTRARTTLTPTTADATPSVPTATDSFDPTSTTSPEGLESTASPQSAASNDGSGGGLSSGARIGLGLGLGVGAALLIVAVVLLCLARRRKRDRLADGAKNKFEVQSEVSMVDAPAAGIATAKAHQSTQDPPPPRYSPREQAREPVENVNNHSGGYAVEPPPQNVFQTPVEQSPVTPLQPEAHNRSVTHGPPALVIPGAHAASDHSRGISSGHSPVSPVSPVSARSPVHSRPPSPKQR